MQRTCSHVNCSVLQSVAICCSFAAVFCAHKSPRSKGPVDAKNMFSCQLESVAVCCSVLQSVAGSCEDLSPRCRSPEDTEYILMSILLAF